MKKENAIKVDACIITFSHEIEKAVVEKYAATEIAALWCATGKTAEEKDAVTMLDYIKQTAEETHYRNIKIFKIFLENNF